MQEARDRLDRDGFVVFEGALRGGHVTRLVHAVDRVAAERSATAEDVHELSFLGHDDAFVELLDHPAVLGFVIAVLGPNVYVYHCHLDVHRPRAAEPRWRWHQDGGRQNLDLDSPRPRLSLKAAYFLTDVASEAQGPLWLLRGSHRADTLARPTNGAVRPPGAEPLLVRAGTAVVFDRRIWHARGDNVSTVTRKALFYAYTYRWVRPRDEPSLTAEQVAELDPIRRQLAGWGADALSYWFPRNDEAPLVM
jgi:ectoine hydroxylase